MFERPVRLRSSLRRRLRQWRLKRRLLAISPRRVNVGAGKSEYCGWISTDRNTLDITSAKDWRRVLGDYRADAILAEHVFEHLTLQEAHRALTNIEHYLRVGGVFRMAVPDGFHPSEYVQELIRPGGLDPGANDHKLLLTIDDVLQWAMLYQLNPLPVEYFRRDGVFVKNPMDLQHGYVSRSAAHYRGRFTESTEEFKRLLETTPRPLRAQFDQLGVSYTSLIVDWVKT